MLSVEAFMGMLDRCQQATEGSPPGVQEASAKFAESIDRSIMEGREVNRTICASDDGRTVTVAEYQCLGAKSECRRARCPKGESLWGDFHTHPGADAVPSTNDILDAVVHELRLTCIGSKDGTNCYAPLDNLKTRAMRRYRYEVYGNIEYASRKFAQHVARVIALRMDATVNPDDYVAFVGCVPRPGGDLLALRAPIDYYDGGPIKDVQSALNALVMLGHVKDKADFLRFVVNQSGRVGCTAGAKEWIELMGDRLRDEKVALIKPSKR